jgi:hypothetical protein
MFKLREVLACLVLSGSLWAQLPIDGPVAGFVFDPPTKSFRAVVGTLGSAFLGGILAEPFQFGSVAPLHNHAIAWLDGRLLLVSGLGTDQVATVKISDEGSVPQPDGAVWSADGTVAVLFSREKSWILPVRGLPDAPSLGEILEVSSTGGSLAAVAADRNGENLLLATTGESAGLYRLQDGSQLLKLADLAAPVALSLGINGQSVYAIDAASMRIVKLDLSGRDLDSWAIEGVQQPVALAVTRDSEGKTLVHVAAAGDRAVITYDASERQATSRLELLFEPKTIEQFGKESFLLRPRLHEGDPIWALTAAPLPQAKFIPATPIAVGEESGQ